MPIYCSFGCVPTKGITNHKYPNPKKFLKRFLIWVKMTGGNVEKESEYVLYKNKYICDKHFAPKYRNRFRRLNALAIPTVNIPASAKKILDHELSLLDPTESAQLQEGIPSKEDESLNQYSLFEDTDSIDGDTSSKDRPIDDSPAHYDSSESDIEITSPKKSRTFVELHENDKNVLRDWDNLKFTYGKRKYSRPLVIGSNSVHWECTAAAGSEDDYIASEVIKKDDNVKRVKESDSF